MLVTVSAEVDIVIDKLQLRGVAAIEVSLSSSSNISKDQHVLPYTADSGPG